MMKLRSVKDKFSTVGCVSSKMSRVLLLSSLIKLEESFICFVRTSKSNKLGSEKQIQRDFKCIGRSLSRAVRWWCSWCICSWRDALERYNKMKGNGPERLVSGSDDFTMFLWEPAVSTHPKTRLTGHQQLVNHVYFSPDGQWVASASFDRSVKLWNGVTGKFVAAFRGHVGPVYQISWSADSRLLLSGSKDSMLKVWDIRTQKLKQDLPGHADEVFFLPSREGYSTFVLLDLIVSDL
ncbi:notchless protein homolog isoform X1 [Manihot esculenta]|uniref:notchless protein homolog isoform X1 n=1 Tax=Manihot esculenta TaxID=3983 RepID=UPI001CC6B0F7|nr:notchless protein homolog isoform X1 [Manihot esculenta]